MEVEILLLGLTLITCFVDLVRQLHVQVLYGIVVVEVPRRFAELCVLLAA